MQIGATMKSDLELSPAIAAYAAKLRGLDLPPAGGRISGPGTSRSDSVPAKIKENGEPIKVSNRERVVSAEQRKLLNTVAQGAGYETLDAMFEDLGMPIGPAIKGGKRAAADGMPPEQDKPMPISTPASQLGLIA